MNDFYSNLIIYIVVGWLLLTPVMVLIQQDRLRIRGMFRRYKYERLKRKDSTEDEVARALFKNELQRMKYFPSPAAVDEYVKQTFPNKATIREAAYEAWLVRKQKGPGKPLSNNPEKEKKMKENTWRLVRLYANRILTSINL